MSQEIVSGPRTVSDTKCLNAGTALIADAASSMGAVYSERLARRGYDLILVGRDRERLSALARRLAVATGRAVVVLVADLNEKADLAHVEQLLHSDATITLLVNNIRTTPRGESTSAAFERPEHGIHLDALAPPRLSLAAIRGFVQRGSGTLIDIDRILTPPQQPWSANDTGAPARLLDGSRRLQREVAARGVRVQVVLAPSVLDVEAMVDASLVGLDVGESVTIPAFPYLVDWG